MSNRKGQCGFVGFFLSKFFNITETMPTVSFHLLDILMQVKYQFLDQLLEF